MGTWDVGSFGNDTAGDWSYGLEGVHDLSYIETALDRTLAFTAAAVVPADAAEVAVAAAEVVARLKGNWGEENPYSKAADDWVRAHALTPPPAMLEKAVRVLDRIVAAPSELLDLWEESGEANAWINAVSDLKRRLGSR